MTASRARRPSTHAGISDTVFVGYTPGMFNSGNNWWSIYAGTGKDDYNRPINGIPHKGVWDWENMAFGDSLQGWWPVRLLYRETGGSTTPDHNRPWWALDMGNQANYRIHQNNRRTFGVVGVWHRDGGANVPAPPGRVSPSWTPLAGSWSAWMGLRAHKDLAVVDPITNNPFNEDVLRFNGVNSPEPSGNAKGFPGYGSQMDQMLYRDIDMTGNTSASLTIEFQYQTRMSPGFDTDPATRTGWFDSDPLGVTAGLNPNPQPNNFISSTAAGAAAPRDSFMVYVGAGVSTTWTPAANNFGQSYPPQSVHDQQRRWFGEVLRWDRDPGSPSGNPQPLHYRQLLSVAGDAGPTTRSFTIPNAMLAPMLAAGNNRIRLVFRVKTNRGWDDEDALYSSSAAGAAVVDDVRYRFNAGPFVTFGDFESAASIDNNNAISPVQAWKSTGKPPAIQEHAHLFADLVYEDIHGQKGDVSRICNLSGVVVSAGDHDNSEAAGGLVDGTADRERATGIVSPAIALIDNDSDPETRNPHGLYGIGGNLGVGDIEANEYYVEGDLYTGVSDPAERGNLYTIGAQSYPALDKNGRAGWGQIRFSASALFNIEKECFRIYEPLFSQDLIRTSNPSGIPDSLRIVLSKLQQCFRFGVSVGCSPTDGLYWDNITLAINDAPPGFPITIDVDNLETQSFRILGGCRTGTQVVTLAEGSYTIETCNVPPDCRGRPAFHFGVDASGHVTYDPLLEPLVGGAGTSTLTINAFGFPPRGDDVAPSMGQFRIVVDPAYWATMEGDPGFAEVNGVHRLISPVLFDGDTRVGRSDVHRHGSAADVNGTAVGTAGTNISDSHFTVVPPGFQGPSNTLEIHTELVALNLVGAGVAVRAGTYAPTHPVQAFSPGEIEATAGAQGAFPAESFFDVFVEVDLPTLGTLYNSEALLIHHTGIACFPPRVVYTHSMTGPVPVRFKASGELFGYLTLAGHGMDFDAGTANPRPSTGLLNDPFKEFAQIMQALPEMADATTLNIDSRDIVHFAAPAAFAQAGYRDSLENGLVQILSLIGSDPCAARALAAYFFERVDGLSSPPDWIVDATVRRIFMERLVEMVNHIACTSDIRAPGPSTGVEIVAVRPNPTTRMTTIGFVLPRAGRATLAIYDLSGRKIRTLADTELPAGPHWVIWEGTRDGGARVPSGTYFARLTSGGVTRNRTITVTH